MPSPMRSAAVVARAIDAAFPAWALIGLLGVIVVLTRGSSLIVQREVTTMLMYVVVVVGLYIFMGTSGVLSFGHISFMTIGAYVTAFATMPPEIKGTVYSKLPTFLADTQLGSFQGLLLGAVAAGVFALFIAYPICRLPAISLGLAMFALLLAVNVASQQTTSLLTGGQTSVFGIPQATTVGSALGFASIAIIFGFFFQRARVGLRLIASREDEFAATASGINVALHRGIAFVVSAFVVGFGGGVFVQFLGTLSPDTFFFSTTMLTLAMLVVGGFNSLSGAVAGAVLVSGISTGLRELESGLELGPISIPARPGLTALGLGAMLLLMLVFRPSGVTGSREIPMLSTWAALLPRVRRRLEPAGDIGAQGSGVPAAEPDGSDHRSGAEGGSE